MPSSVEACLNSLLNAILADQFTAAPTPRALLFILCIMLSFIFLALEASRDGALIQARHGSTSTSSSTCTLPECFHSTTDPPDANIYHLHGQLSHYFPNPVGNGVDEYPLPPGANITQLHMLSRHGARYPTTGEFSATIPKLFNRTRDWTAHGALSFLNTWTPNLGTEILVPLGKQELFDSGTLHRYQYGHLSPTDGTKILARSTTQDRMRQSAEYFLAGFFGQQWRANATLELITEQSGANNTLAGYLQCPNSNAAVSTQGTVAQAAWTAIYLAAATRRLQALISPADTITVTDAFNFQSLCAYETVSHGHSAFCALFTADEWAGYEYAVDVRFASNSGFQSPTGRAVGIGWVAELRARLRHRLIPHATAQVNTTLDGSERTFPLRQTLYFDFSHDTNMMSVLAALGLRQFAALLPPTAIKRDRWLVVSRLQPFAARLDVEVIKTPKPVKARRGRASEYGEEGEGDFYEEGGDGGETTYVHFVLNQRTIPLGMSYEGCGERDDGWCELGAFMEAMEGLLEEAQYEHACFGEYDVVPYGTLSNGVPAS